MFDKFFGIFSLNASSDSRSFITITNKARWLIRGGQLVGSRDYSISFHFAFLQSHLTKRSDGRWLTTRTETRGVGKSLLMFNYEVRCEFWQFDIKILCRLCRSTNLFDRASNICRSNTHEQLFGRQTTRINVKPHRLSKVISQGFLFFVNFVCQSLQFTCSLEKKSEFSSAVISISFSNWIFQAEWCHFAARDSSRLIIIHKLNTLFFNKNDLLCASTHAWLVFGKQILCLRSDKSTLKFVFLLLPQQFALEV